jgi:outer membrane protein assembly factor BamB
MGALYSGENFGILRRIQYSKTMFRQHTLTFCLLLALASTAFAADKDWPQWRGPNRDGISTETGLLKEWPSDGPPLAWRTKGLGRGMSSVAIADGRVFTQGAANKNGQRGVFVNALDPADGKEIWSAAITTGREPQPNGTPTVDGRLLFAVGNDGDVACLETETGKLVWKKNFGSDFGGKCMSSWGILLGDHIYMGHGHNNGFPTCIYSIQPRMHTHRHE